MVGTLQKGHSCTLKVPLHCIHQKGLGEIEIAVSA